MTDPTYTKVELLTLSGPEFRRVSTAATRPATADEIPIINLDGMWFYKPESDSDLEANAKAKEAKQRIATEIRAAATSAGFFYVTNHGIPHDVVAAARENAQRFFSQSLEDKLRVHSRLEPLGNGYSPVHSGQINRSETKDLKEGFNFRYQPENDPLHAGKGPIDADKSQGSDWTWEQTQHLPGFKEATVTWWQGCLQLARGLVRLFALALELPEDYFDELTTYPGSDGLYICYPGNDGKDGQDIAAETRQRDIDVGIGSHTDMQCFTLLWQDESGGLEVLLPSSTSSTEDPLYEWVGATPQPDTLVVNIADFLQRLSNDRFRSTVHRVYNRKAGARYSMPFFFGFNSDAECAVVPTCVDDAHPPRYAPITCGKWRDERMRLARAAQAS